MQPRHLRCSRAVTAPVQAVTHDAALCIARLDGMSEGLSGLNAGLTYYYGEICRIVWDVQNTTYRHGDQPGR